MWSWIQFYHQRSQRRVGATGPPFFSAHIKAFFFTLLSKKFNFDFKLVLHFFSTHQSLFFTLLSFFFFLNWSNIFSAHIKAFFTLLSFLLFFYFKLVLQFFSLHFVICYSIVWQFLNCLFQASTFLAAHIRAFVLFFSGALASLHSIYYVFWWYVVMSKRIFEASELQSQSFPK